MSFQSLLKRLATCAIKKTSFRESGGRISVRPQADETIRFFVIDEAVNSNCTIRRELNIVGAICDLIVSYVKANKLLCLVESKGKNVRYAVEQVINTQKNLHKTIATSQPQDFIWKAYIYQHGSAPNSQDRKWIKHHLETHFGKNNYRVSRNSDIGNFLRQ